MKKGFFLSLVFLCTVTWSSKGLAAELKSINFFQKGELSQLEMVFDSNEVQAKKFHVTEDKQIIVDLKDIAATERVMRAFDTSEFSGSIVFVSAYKKPNSKNDIRIALQLRDNVRSVLKRKKDRLVLEVENRFGVFTQNTVEENQSFEEKVSQAKAEVGRLNIPKSEAIEDILENLTLSGRKKYIGKRVSFNVKAVSVEDILKMIAEVSGFNIILTSEVKELDPLSLSLTNVPWDQALDTILGLYRLVAKKNGIILMIETLEKATADKKKEVEAKRLTEKEEPLVTKVFPISYADVRSLATLLKEYSTKERGSIGTDKRTNSIIIKDTSDVIEKVKKIVEVLDTQTPQVQIAAKIVEVNEAYLGRFGLTNGLQFQYDPIGSLGEDLPGGIGNGTPGGTADSGPGFRFSSAPTNGNGLIFGVDIGRFGRVFALNLALELMESESKGRVISSPKVVTQNKQKASITSERTVGIAESTSVQADGSIQVQFASVKAQITLEVTPQVTNEGSISLEVNIIREGFETQVGLAPPVLFKRNVKTNVLVDNGSTVVLGGLYQYTTSESHSGIPFLKDIPLIGWLFRTPFNPEKTKDELIIFVTPRIINQEEAGISRAI
ncbi:MAG: type IV pilus secretin PilQ [Halobacteriovoraceae bacterium]|jgi:type IV pilus assembly protein PilQ|nr:type IV pilus secretin PilQ [Halobacteriovoraceae bacterium]